MEAVITGTVEAGAGTISGSMSSGFGAFHQILEVASSGHTQETEMIGVGGMVYERDGELWFESPQTTAGTPFDALPGDFASLTDLGLVERNGDRLHRLVLTEPVEIDAGSLGFTDPSISGFSADFEFFATAEGVPAGLVLSATWTQQASEEPISGEMTLDYAFAAVGEPVHIVAPEDIWVRFTSDALGYRIAHPSSWDFQHIAADGEYLVADDFLSPVKGASVSEVMITRCTDFDQAVTPNAWFVGTAQVLEEEWATPVETSEPLAIEGVDAQLFDLHGEIEGDAVYYQQAAVFLDGVAWDVSWYSDPGTEEQDRKLFLRMLSTFSPTP